MDGYGRRIALDLPYEIAIGALRTALAGERVTILGESQVHEYLERTVHHGCRHYALMGVAIPEVVLDALRVDLSIGPLLVTTIAIFELADGETALVVAEPFGGLGSHASWREANPALAALADRTCDRLARALSALEETARTSADERATVEA